MLMEMVFMSQKVKPDDLNRLLSKKGDPYKIIESELGPAVAEYRRKWSIAGKDGKAFEYPLHLNFELTFGCNLRCKFCPYSVPLSEWGYKVNTKEKIQFDKYCEIIDDGVKNGLCSVALNGNNEPFLQKDIIDYIRYAKKAGVLEISLHTNGLALTESISKELLDAGLTIIMFSVDAVTKETYEKIRCGGDYDAVVKNVETFLELKKTSGKVFPLTRISFVKNKVNINEFGDFIDYWDEKIDFFAIQTFFNPFVGKSNYDEIESLYRFEGFEFDVCFQPYQRLFILNDGKVAPCCSNYGAEMIVGDIYENSIFEIWNGEKMKELRSSLNEGVLCRPEACTKCRASVSSLENKQTVMSVAE